MPFKVYSKWDMVVMFCDRWIKSIWTVEMSP